MTQREKFEKFIWEFIQQHMVPLIQKHQVRSGESKAMQFEELLHKAVNGQSPQVVTSCIAIGDFPTISYSSNSSCSYGNHSNLANLIISMANCWLQDESSDFVFFYS